MKEQLRVFLSQYIQWELKRGMSKTTASKLAKVMRRIFEIEIPSRDDSAHVMIRDLTNSSKLRLRMFKEEVLCYSVDDEYLMTGVVYPYWNRGWRQYCKDDMIEDSVSGFFHFASQYIARSRVIDIIGAIGLTYNRACDFRGNRGEEFSVGRLGISSLEEALRVRNINRCEQIDYGRKERRFLAWYEMLNSLDPFVNRIVFNYVRAVDLFDNNFAEEAITALDNTVDVIGQLVRDRLKLSETDQRLAIAYAFQLSKSEVLTIERLYSLRCYFGAHPSLSKWWDFFELYEFEFEDFFETVKKLIYNSLQLEQAYRKVERNPNSWSDWLNENLFMLWNAVWFHRIPL